MKDKIEIFKYPKIKTIWKRDIQGNIIEGDYSTPEIEFLKDNVWIFEEKIDGTNIRVYWDSEENKIEFRGKTDNAQIPEFLLKRLKEQFTVYKFKKLFPETSMYLFGEGYGNRIQKIGKRYIKDKVDFILFDAIIGRYWLCRSDIEEIAAKLEIKTAPIIGEGTLKEACELVKNGFTSKVAEDKTLIAEGLVLKPKIQMLDRRGHRIVTKIKYIDYNQKIQGGKTWQKKNVKK